MFCQTVTHLYSTPKVVYARKSAFDSTKVSRTTSEHEYVTECLQNCFHTYLLHAIFYRCYSNTTILIKKFGDSLSSQKFESDFVRCFIWVSIRRLDEWYMGVRASGRGSFFEWSSLINGFLCLSSGMFSERLRILPRFVN